MYKINDAVVYPTHGVGKIVKIEKQLILEKRIKYYIIEFINNNIKIMVPVEKSDEIGIRPVIKNSKIIKVLKILKERAAAFDDDWKARFQINNDKIKTGSIFEIARVVKDLYKRNKRKELSLMERKLYDNAYNHLITEIAISKKAAFEKVEKIINKILS
ncbi:MAG: CarD family transcriptional regulator [bacterium]|nr:CarD family transcriptional regulator [bacterium]